MRRTPSFTWQIIERSSTFRAMPEDQLGSRAADVLFQLSSVANYPAQNRRQISRHIQASASAFLAIGKNECLVFPALGTSRTVSPNTGFTHLGERTLCHGPELFDLAQERLPVLVESICSFHTGMYIISHTYMQAKKTGFFHAVNGVLSFRSRRIKCAVRSV